MEFEISSSEFTSSIELVKKYIAEASHKSVTRIEYRTHDEGMCDADIFVVAKDKVQSKLEAFVTLCTFYVHFYEEWPLADTNSENADSFFKLWLLPRVEGYSFAGLSAVQIRQQMDWVIDSILKVLADNKKSEKTNKRPDRWGVYVNDQAIPIDSTVDNLGLGQILSGIGLDLKWNSVEIMYETPSFYVFFAWGTGA